MYEILVSPISEVLEELEIKELNFKKCTAIKKQDSDIHITVCPLRNNCARFLNHYQKNQTWLNVPYNKQTKECKQFIEFKQNDY